MKLKYYLRGIGIGVIVATLVMTVSSGIHNNNLSDETIIKEAQKLGMIMPENTESKDDLWEKNTEENESVSELFSTEDLESTDNEVSTENLQTTESETTDETVETTEDKDAKENEISTNTTESESEEPDTVWITVEDTDGARHVALKLKSAGVIDDAADFRSYLKQNGYATVIRSGHFRIPMDATYEEICRIIIRKTN